LGKFQKKPPAKAVVEASL